MQHTSTDNYSDGAPCGCLMRTKRSRTSTLSKHFLSPEIPMRAASKAAPEAKPHRFPLKNSSASDSAYGICDGCPFSNATPSRSMTPENFGLAMGSNPSAYFILSPNGSARCSS
ncbi:hypothetical protein EJ06DRAFT_123013 [Trichodelitschia bisporula]|uniref:Uncharacterized protein n=1 Tax=Trichodelitschia bisporula TaxID=703511 RepID=A0A6G1HQA1_9PEZI|nr:hypothetical protein EJ06DRAFT_123013 [Trichodelitschia bisporula]